MYYITSLEKNQKPNIMVVAQTKAIDSNFYYLIHDWHFNHGEYR